MANKQLNESWSIDQAKMSPQSTLTLRKCDLRNAAKSAGQVAGISRQLNRFASFPLAYLLLP
jgi:hypothetical protein